MSQVTGTPTQVLPVGMLPAKYVQREESPSPPPLPTTLPPVYQTTQTIGITPAPNNNNNNHNIVSGFAKMGMDDEEDDKKPKPGLSLLANLPPPPERRPMMPHKKPPPKPKTPSASQEKPEEDEPQYTGYINPRKQSASFMRLAQTLNTDEAAAGGGLISSQEDLSRFARSPSRGTPEPSQQNRVQSPSGQLLAQSITNSIASTGSRGSRGSSARSSISESQGGEDYDLENRRDSHPQSKSFLMLQQHLEEDDGAPKSVFDKVGGPNAPNPELPCPSGVTPIKPVSSINKNIAPGNVTRRSQGNIVLQTCYHCGNSITGRFSRVHGHPFHQNCFRCKICRMDLMDVGYFWIEDNMYCQTHALQVAKPPAPGMVPVILN